MGFLALILFLFKPFIERGWNTTEVKHHPQNTYVSQAFFWLFFQNSRAAKLNVFQNSSKFFAKLKENILKLNISEIFVVVDLFSILQIK